MLICRRSPLTSFSHYVTLSTLLSNKWKGVVSLPLWSFPSCKNVCKTDLCILTCSVTGLVYIELIMISLHPNSKYKNIVYSLNLPHNILFLFESLIYE